MWGKNRTAFLVSIPERVLEALKRTGGLLANVNLIVSIPERVLEALKRQQWGFISNWQHWFQSLKGF